MAVFLLSPQIGKMEKDYQMFQEAGIAPGVFQPLPLPDGMAVSSTEVIASLNEHLVVVLQVRTHLIIIFTIQTLICL